MCRGLVRRPPRRSPRGRPRLDRSCRSAARAGSGRGRPSARSHPEKPREPQSFPRDRIVGRMKSLWTATENSCVVRDAEGLIRPWRSRARWIPKTSWTSRLLGIGLMCIHNPCDEIGRRVMDETLRAGLRSSPRVRDAIDVLYSIPEFQAAKTRIVLRMGKIDNSLGKWAVHHGAGTNGGVPIARAAYEHGIDTVFYIHIDAGALRRLWELYGREGSKNLVVTGHLASDSIGINALVRELRARRVRVDTYSGIVDV